ncbi:MAG TPA: diaminopimelate epimerase [Thermomicrobiales bacterium]
MTSPAVHWTRAHGLGNDYLIVEPTSLPSGVRLTPRTVRLICDRHRGVGSDGILQLLPSISTPERFTLRIWNPDGSTAEKSGNGLRIFAKYLREHGHTPANNFTIVTPGGAAAIALDLDPQTGRVAAITVDMGVPTFDPRTQITVASAELDVIILSVGNPHCVTIVPDTDAIDLERLGPLIEHHPAFPERTNVQFATPVAPDRVRAIVWERGAGITLASGSSASAVAAACHRLGLVGNMVTVAMPGGELVVRIGDDGQLSLTGPAEEICRGIFSADLLDRLRALSAEGD